MQPRLYPSMGLALAATVLALVGACSTSDPTVSGAGGKATSSAGTSAGAAGGGSSGGTGSGTASGSGNGSGAHAVKACALITGAEAATALGAGSPLKAKTDTDTACEYQGANEADAVSVDVETEPYEKGTEDIVVNMLGKDMAKKVDGLGDAAFVYNQNFQVQYHIWAKGKYLLIVVSKLNGGNLDAPAKTVAQTAVSRL